MKKLLVILLSLTVMSTAFAYDTAKLRMKIAGINSNKYLLCIPGRIGCVSMLAGNKGKVFPIEVGQVYSIFTVDATTLRMHTQSLPGSCSKTLSNNQTLTVSGTLVKSANRVYLNNLRCSVG